MKIEDYLKSYMVKKAKLETTLTRIIMYKDLINKLDTEDYIHLAGAPKELGMPKAQSSASSPVEAAVDAKEYERSLINKWIQEEEARVFWLKLEVGQIEIALDYLNEEEKYIIECKYFKNMFWRDIEISFNQKFRGDNAITAEGIKKILKGSDSSKGALDRLEAILKPFYARFQVA